PPARSLPLLRKRRRGKRKRSSSAIARPRFSSKSLPSTRPTRVKRCCDREPTSPTSSCFDDQQGLLHSISNSLEGFLPAVLRRSSVVSLPARRTWLIALWPQRSRTTTRNSLPSSP